MPRRGPGLDRGAGEPENPRLPGAIAQLGERYNGIVEVGGSIPPGSTRLRAAPARRARARTRPHRLEAQDTALSRRRRGFDSPWGRQSRYSRRLRNPPAAPRRPPLRPRPSSIRTREPAPRAYARNAPLDHPAPVHRRAGGMGSRRRGRLSWPFAPGLLSSPARTGAAGRAAGPAPAADPCGIRCQPAPARGEPPAGRSGRIETRRARE